MKKDLEPDHKHALQTTLILIVICTLICFFLLLTYIEENKNTREIIFIQPTVTETNDQEEKSQTKSVKTSEKSSNKKNSTSDQDNLSSLLQILETESTWDKVYSKLNSQESLPESVAVSSAHSDITSEPESTIPESSQAGESVPKEESSSSEGEKPPVSFTDVVALQQWMAERFQMQVVVSTEETPLTGYETFLDAKQALVFLTRLCQGFLKIPQETWEKVLEQQIPMTLFVVPQIPDSIDSVQIRCSDENIVIMTGDSEQDWSFELCRQFMKLCDDLIGLNQRLEEAYSLFLSQNPSDFEYQQYRPEYLLGEVGMSYFLDVFSQSDPAADRQTLFAYYYTGLIPEEYLNPSCPIYSKLAALEQSIDLGLTKKLPESSIDESVPIP